MRTEYLQYLLEVNSAGTISAAANKLYLRQSTLSAIISTLEDEIGVKIFTRSRRGVSPTPEGELVLAYAEEVIRRSNALREALSSKSTIRRLVSLISYPSACNAFGPALARSLNEHFLDVSLVLHDSPINTILSNIYNGVAKIAVCADYEENIQDYMALGKDYQFETLYEDHFYLVTAASSHYAERPVVHVDELINEHLVFAHYYPSGSDAAISSQFRRFERFSVLSSNSTMKKAVLENNMIALMPGLALYDDIYVKTGQLRCVRVDGFAHSLYNFVLYASELDKAEGFLLDEIRRMYRALPDTLFC